MHAPGKTPDARQIAAVMGRRTGEISSTEVAKRIGVHPRTVRRAYKRGALPGAKEHGERILVIPMGVFRLIEAYGLHGVEKMAAAGLIAA